MLPFKRAINFAGMHTYSIYLFHGGAFKIFQKLGVIQLNSTELHGVLIWLLTLPVFFVIFAAFETVVNEFVFGSRSIVISSQTFFKK